MKYIGFSGKYKCLLMLIGLLLVSTIGVIIIKLYIRDSGLRIKTISLFYGATYLGAQNVVFQETKNDCGPAALKMVFDYYGIPSGLEELRYKLMSKRGVSMLSMKGLAEAKGLKAEGWHYNKNELRHVKLPVIALVRGGHYVVISEIKNNLNFVILDPALGKLEFPFQRFCRIWRGDLLIFKPIKNMESNNTKEEVK